uniref:UBC core domain-containing protein n=1 Tax=Chromera velia CCMP2878 TaxID=1169474 RepID=A0A0G4I903_9ALVE|eukprot:Cvel_12080.t1-p1 / transcript=Cvel_12080.t1 / gene=Cvel_12080 / organism=Chromera_velia_CCMP2878 / gene_product=Ubiquitin-conjugating enzyme E2 2, putative / transcript_product=Ubiquitin-conjugating enzyme E2 2, putative / location=Cvel_scaffold777:44419-47479(+) / protein_length=893 / sequence_SO=supercontig / SO=protein_coding / is_pseudo=false
MSIQTSTSLAMQRTLRRLRTDLREIAENPFELLSAQPLKDDLLCWHCNLLAALGTPYEGFVFHLQLRFTDQYPKRAPKLTLLTPMRHQNVFGSYVCLDVFEEGEWSGEETMRPYTGWTPAFSVQSVMMQLQSFLMETYYTDPSDVQWAHQRCSSFSCRSCEHTGTKPWPPLPSRPSTSSLQHSRASRPPLPLQHSRGSRAHPNPIPAHQRADRQIPGLWPQLGETTTTPTPTGGRRARRRQAAQAARAQEEAQASSPSPVPPQMATVPPPMDPVVPSTRPSRAHPSPSTIVPSACATPSLVPSSPHTSLLLPKTPNPCPSAAASTSAALSPQQQDKVDTPKTSPPPLNLNPTVIPLERLPGPSLLSLLSFLSLGDLRNLSGVSQRLEILSDEAFNRRPEILNSVRCFFTKRTPLKEENSKDVCVLGVGLAIERHRVTSNLVGVRSSFDLLSLDAFEVDRVRLSVWKEPFEFFLPVVIDESHWAHAKNKAERVLTQLVLNLKDVHPDWVLSFKPEYVLKVLPPLMNSQVVDLMKGGTHASTKALEGYCTTHHLFLQLCHDYPALQQALDAKARRFANSAAARHKFETPSLGDFIACLSVTDAVAWKDIAEPLISEVFDRNVLWILKEYPYLGDTNRPFGDFERMQKALSVNAVSLRLLVFQVWFLENVARRRHLHFPSSTSRVLPGEQSGHAVECSRVGCALRTYSSARGRPAPSLVDRLQRRVKSLLSLNSWPAFFEGVQLPQRDPKSVAFELREAAGRSEQKGYHTQEDCQGGSTGRRDDPRGYQGQEGTRGRGGGRGGRGRGGASFRGGFSEREAYEQRQAAAYHSLKRLERKPKETKKADAEGFVVVERGARNLVQHNDQNEAKGEGAKRDQGVSRNGKGRGGFLNLMDE